MRAVWMVALSLEAIVVGWMIFFTAYILYALWG